MSEKIVIIYLNNGNMSSEVTKEVMFNRVVNDLIDKGKAVDTTVFDKYSKKALFNDGSMVELVPIRNAESYRMKGYRGVSNMYLDESILRLPNSTGYILEQLMPCCQFNKESFMSYSVNNGELSISNIFKENDNE